MDVVPTRADKVLAADGVCTRLVFAPEPGIFRFQPQRFFARILVLEGQWHRAEETRTSLANISRKNEGANVLADAIINVWMPTLDLVFDRSPPNKYIDRGLAFEDGSEFHLKDIGCAEAGCGTRLVGLGIFRLLLNPIT